MSVETLINADSFRATAAGFTCTCAGEPREYRDDDVVGLSTRKQRILAADGTGLTREELSIRVLDPNVSQVEVDAEYSGPDDNFLAPFRDRLLASLTERATATLVQEDQFDGGPWAIGLDGVYDKASGTRISLDSISHVAWRSGRFCLFRAASDDAAASFSADAENTHVLAQVISKLLRLDWTGDDNPETDPGRTAYEFRDTSFKAQAWIGAAAGVGLVLVATAIKLAAAGQPILIGAAAAGGVVMLAVAGILYWKIGAPAILRLSEHALALVRAGRETILPLSDLAEFTAEWSDYYRNGVYQATLVQFQFTSNDPSRPPLKYDAQATYGAPKFDELQKFQAQVSAVIAERMGDELANAGRVLWTARLALLPGALEFVKKAGDESRVIAYSQITQWEVDQGLLKVAIDGSQKPNIVEPTDQPNFFPGLVLFKELSNAPGSAGPLCQGVHLTI